MPAPNEKSRSDAIVQVRMPQQTKDLINTAAEAMGKSLSAFITESASRQASDVLLDQRLFTLDAEASEAFARVLDVPPPPTERLRQLLAARSPWE
jgi:uncharacterized protein (DUF1778 family)